MMRNGPQKTRKKGTHSVYSTLGMLKVPLSDIQHMDFIGKETLCIMVFKFLLISFFIIILY